jgi:hypothetical protein
VTTTKSLARPTNPGAAANRERAPHPLGPALRRIAACAGTTAVMLARRRLRLPHTNLGRRLTFADGTNGVIYRETLVTARPVHEPVVLVVEFRLKVLGGRWGHAYFRAVSLLNTPLFAGFPGLVSKLWVAADERGRYRGVYQWDGSDSAEDYVRALWWPLALVSHRDSIHYRILANTWRDDVLRPTVQQTPHDQAEWWRITDIDPPMP